MGKSSEDHSQEPYIVSFAHYLKNGFGNDLKSVGTGTKNDTVSVLTAAPTNDAQDDYDSIVKLILDFEASYDTGKNLTVAAIKRYQSRLDKISGQYHYDSSLDGLYCAFYELQALIYKAQLNDEAAMKFLAECSDLKPQNQSFISAAAQKWYSEGSEPTVNKYPSTEPRVNRKKHLFTNKEFIILGIIILGAASAIGYGPVSDYLTIRNANPAMVNLAQDAGMSTKGEVLFLRTNPQLVNDAQLAQFCPDAQTNNSGFIEQGCFVPNQSDPTTGKIYIRQMSSDLYDLEVTTAAYEMLHPAYASLTIDSSSALNSAIESNYASVDDPTIAADVALFAKTEPGDRDDELFSMLGTSDYDSLSATLQSYYTPYLTNPDTVVNYNNQVNALFQNDQTQLTQLNNTLNSDQNTINTVFNEANTAYADSVSWANVGNAYGDNYNYNIYSQDYNTYSQDIDDYNNTVDQYNQTLNSYDKLVTEYNGQQFNQASTIQSQQQQSQ